MTPWFRLFQGDAVQLLRELPDESIDLVVTDPPYESLEKHRAIGTTTRLKRSKASSNDWFAIFPNSRFDELFGELFRVLKCDRHLYVMCDPETMFVAKPAGERAGFKFWKPVIWDKVTIGMGYHYRGRYEAILFFEKGKRRLSDLGVADVLPIPRVRNGYPAEKPQALCDVLIRQSSAQGEVVLDPFMGSGSAGAAALSTGRSFVGGDLCAEAMMVARQRLVACGGVESTLEQLPRRPVARQLGLLPSAADAVDAYAVLPSFKKRHY